MTSRVYYTRGVVTEHSESAGYADAVSVKVETNYHSDTDPSDATPFQKDEELSFKLLNMANV